MTKQSVLAVDRERVQKEQSKRWGKKKQEKIIFESTGLLFRS